MQMLSTNEQTQGTCAEGGTMVSELISERNIPVCVILQVPPLPPALACMIIQLRGDIYIYPMLKQGK